MAKLFDNDAVVTSALNDTFEVVFIGSGTDSAENPFKSYYHLVSAARTISVKSDQIAQITEINNQVLKSPINIAANKAWSSANSAFKERRFIQVKVKAVTSTATQIEVYGEI